MDGSDDDDLPCVLNSPRKKDKEFKKGDVVFGKLKTWPYWPGLFFRYIVSKNRKKTKKAYIYFFERANRKEDKTVIYPIPLTRIKPFACEDRQKFEEIGKDYEDFVKGIEEANDYLRKRACNKIKDFFENVVEVDDEDEDDEGADDEDVVEHNNGEKTESRPSFLQRLEDTELNEQQEYTENTKADLQDHYVDRRSSRQKRLISKKIIAWINIEGRVVLNDITLNRRKSTRHKAFMRGTQRERNELKYIAGYGPIKDEEEIDKILKVIITWHEEDHPNVPYNRLTYVSEVLLPEAIIYGFMAVKKLSYENASRRFLED